jgi:uncharacterized Fe-S cluster-containing MiaB family protein
VSAAPPGCPWDLTIGCDTCGHMADLGGIAPGGFEEYVKHIERVVASIACSRCGSHVTPRWDPDEGDPEASSA